MNHLDSLDLSSMSKNSLQKTKYDIECELCWIHRDMQLVSERSKMDQHLDKFNKFNKFLSKINIALNLH